MTDLATLTASDITALIARRDVSAREVTTATLSRINAQNPALNAIVQHMPDEALAAADAIDAASDILAGKVRGRLVVNVND
mgnify:CR=1 FL=1